MSNKGTGWWEVDGLHYSDDGSMFLLQATRRVLLWRHTDASLTHR